MFHCGICGKPSAAGERGREVVLERRERIYPRRARAHRVVIEGRDGNSKARTVWVDDPGGTGWEIVRSARACAACADRHALP